MSSLFRCSRRAALLAKDTTLKTATGFERHSIEETIYLPGTDRLTNLRS